MDIKNKMINFIKFLCDSGIENKQDEPMAKHTTFKVGGKAELFITVKNTDELIDVLTYAKRQEIPFFILGKGSNLLVSDKGVKGAVILLDGEFSQIRMIDDTTIYAGSGASLMRVCKFALDNSLSGLEFAYGIPGSVGGAVFMNAGAYGGEMKDCIASVDFLTKDGERGVLFAKDLNLGYRTSAFKSNGHIITGCNISLKRGDKAEIKAKMEDLLNRRKTKQPIEYPSAGSTFKRPKGAFAGTLIESCGLKGFSVGGAQVSEKHAGFVINKGNATAKDINELIKYVQNKVMEETGYFLEPEVIRI